MQRKAVHTHTMQKHGRKVQKAKTPNKQITYSFSTHTVRHLSHTPTQKETMSCTVTVLAVFVRAQGFRGAE